MFITKVAIFSFDFKQIELNWTTIRAITIQSELVGSIFFFSKGFDFESHFTELPLIK